MKAAARTADDDLVDGVAGGTGDDPFAVLGRHATTVGGKPAVVIRTMQHAADKVEVVVSGRATGMARRHPEGVFEAILPLADVHGAPDTSDLAYRLRVHEQGRVRDIVDPYQFGQVLSEFDLHLLGEGTHYHAWEKLGSHRVTVGSVTGVHFAVWAPNAQRVSVIGDINRWDGRVHAMRRLVPSGIWEIFIPDLEDGTRYKYEVRTPAGDLVHKADPYARLFEVPPNTASVVCSETTYRWGDADWMRDRPSFDAWRERPMSIYEIHVGSWRRVSEDGNRYQTYRELADALVPYLREMG